MIILIVALLVSVVVHEVAHGLVAYWLGDDTAYRAGRLTANPIKHMDVVGSVIVPMILLFLGSTLLIGWAKPVPVTLSRLRSPRLGMLLVAIAGPVSNILLAFCSTLLVTFLVGYGWTFMLEFLISMIQINLVLALFNLIPIPPLDGSRILSFFMPDKLNAWYVQMEPYGILLVIGLFSFGFMQRLFSDVFQFLVPIFYPFANTIRDFDTSFEGKIPCIYNKYVRCRWVESQ